MKKLGHDFEKIIVKVKKYVNNKEIVEELDRLRNDFNLDNVDVVDLRYPKSRRTIEYNKQLYDESYGHKEYFKKIEKEIKENLKGNNYQIDQVNCLAQSQNK